jgi:hypothetical protein
MASDHLGEIMKTLITSTGVFAAAAVLAACGLSSTKRPTTSAGAALPKTALGIAVSFLPSNPTASFTIGFADWDVIQRSLGFTTAALDAPHEYKAFGGLVNGLAPGLPSGNASFDLTAGDQPVWSVSDVSWDATESDPLGKRAPLAITGFRPQFALERVGQRLSGCGFASHAVAGIMLYSATAAVAANCSGPFGGEIPMFNNYGLDAADHLILMSTSASAISAALRNRTAHASDPVLGSVLKALGEPSAFAASVGPRFCTALSNPSVFVGPKPTPSTIAQAATMYSVDTAYLGLGFGYTLSRKGAKVRLAMTYADPASALGDLVPRQRVLETGRSILTNTLYSHLMRVESGRADGRTLVFGIEQPAAGPVELGTMFDHSDLGFARC